MKPTTLILPLLLMGMAPMAEAQLFHVSAPSAGGSQLVGRSTKASKAKAMSMSKAKKVQGFGGTAISEVEKYGELELVFEEDFSKMSEGSIEEPAVDINMTIPGDSPEYTYPWWNMDPKYSNEPHWGTGAEGEGAACPAGGCFYMEMIENEWGGCTQAHINTPLIKLDNYDRTAVLEFKARTKNAGETYDWLHIEMADTRNMGPTWDEPEEPIIVAGIPSEWTTYRLIFRHCGPTTIFNLVGFGPGNVYIDDLKVYQVKPAVGLPETTAHSEYKGTSFVANWEPVEGADSYLVSVYQLIAQPGANPMARPTYTQEYVYTDLPAAENHLTITGVQSGETYYYTVKAVKGDKVSLESFPCRVYDLVAPTMKPADILDDVTYTANWDLVPGADVYNYYAYDTRKALVDGPFVVTFEDFNGVKDEDGNETGFTIDSPWDYVVEEYYSAELNQQGWRVEMGYPYTDFICVDAFHYLYNGNQAGFISPEFDMSKDGGKFTVEADLAGKDCLVWLTDTEYEYRYPQACVAVFNWNDALGDYEQSELVYANENDKYMVNGDWQHFTFTLTKGGPRTVFGIFGVYAPDNLYIDNFKVTQNYKAGEYILEPFRFAHWYGRRDTDMPGSIDVVVPDRVLGGDIFHKVSAYSRQADQRGENYEPRESPYTQLEYVMTTKSGVENVGVDSADAPAEYYRIDGVRVASDRLTPGVYVVRRGAKVEKTVVK